MRILFSYGRVSLYKKLRIFFLNREDVSERIQENLIYMYRKILMKRCKMWVLQMKKKKYVKKL